MVDAHVFVGMEKCKCQNPTDISSRSAKNGFLTKLKLGQYQLFTYQSTESSDSICGSGVVPTHHGNIYSRLCIIFQTACSKYKTNFKLVLKQKLSDPSFALFWFCRRVQHLKLSWVYDTTTLSSSYSNTPFSKRIQRGEEQQITNNKFSINMNYTFSECSPCSVELEQDTHHSTKIYLKSSEFHIITTNVVINGWMQDEQAVDSSSSLCTTQSCSPSKKMAFKKMEVPIKAPF